MDENEFGLDANNPMSDIKEIIDILEILQESEGCSYKSSKDYVYAKGYYALDKAIELLSNMNED